MRLWPFGLLVASTAAAQPAPISVNVNGPLQELATQLTAMGPCRFMAMGMTQVNIAMNKVSIWDVLAKIEAQHNHSRISGGTIILDPGPRRPSTFDPALTWVIKLPTKAVPVEEKIPFKFDNVLLDKPGP